MLRTAIAAAVVAVTLAGAAAAQAPKGSMKGVEWSGVWVNTGSISFDPRNPPATPEKPPYNAAYQKEYERRLAEVAAGRAIADPTAACVLPGVPRMMNMPYPFELLFTPGRVTLIAEQMHDVRRIWIDGKHPPADEIELTYNGHSIGHWEGNTLVVDTVGLRGDTVFDQVGTFHSDAMHVVERFSSPDPKTLKVEISVDDPKAFTTPWVVTKTYHRRDGEQLLEYVCEENNRNPIDAEGKTSVILKPKE